MRNEDLEPDKKFHVKYVTVSLRRHLSLQGTVVPLAFSADCRGLASGRLHRGAQSSISRNRNDLSSVDVLSHARLACLPPQR